ncbi:hypothetical protein ACIRP0_27555 [Streptomyces sp. NPDC101733]|uniref:hypothetical protein n=1 Tax=unclassified Streptomyces TaxID=2593676 RepID=UPI00380A9134
MKDTRRGLRALVAAALLAGAITALAGPAAAATDCGYPYVCFYIGESDAGRFKDVTSGWQNLTVSRGAEYADNHRHDDGALLHFTNGRTYCLKPGGHAVLAPMGTVDKLRITDSPQCAV